MVLLVRKIFKFLNKKKEIIDDYDASADFYDKRYRAIQERKYDIVLNNYNLNEKTIIDIGCGTGLFIEHIFNSKKSSGVLKCNYVAVDISWNMLLQFKVKLLKLKNKIKILLILADIENLPFRDNSFNSVFSLTSFQNLPNILSGIRESLRVSLNRSDFKFSILRKKMELNPLLELLTPFVEDLEVINKDFIEDVIIQGKIIKEFV
jgi:ubiquinone/menaquinone biosynthesis C-methylase UbiE